MFGTQRVPNAKAAVLFTSKCSCAVQEDRARLQLFTNEPGRQTTVQLGGKSNYCKSNYDTDMKHPHERGTYSAKPRETTMKQTSRSRFDKTGKSQFETWESHMFSSLRSGVGVRDAASSREPSP